MDQNSNLKHRWVYIIPGIVIIWSFFLNHLAGPFYTTRIDPEYPYLLNGLNCSMLEFIRIGHTDHPGTPFQMITGLFIRITYWFVGQGSIAEDVIKRPELYLSAASSFLSILTAGVVLWLGKVALNSKVNTVGVLILQLSVFFTSVLIDIPSRYIPDRILALYTLIFVGFCIKYFYRENYSARRFAIQAGIIMGIGFITKFNFIPMLLVPFVLLSNRKERITYFASFLITSFLAFIPIHHKFKDYVTFIIGIVKHDGMYGQGEEQVINIQTFLENILLIFRVNISMSMVLVAVLIFLVILILRSDFRQKFSKEYLMLIAISLVLIVSVVITAKHFKNYYLIPLMSLTGFAIFLIWKISQQFKIPSLINKIILLAVLILMFIPYAQLYPAFTYKKHQKFHSKLTTDYLKNNISPDDIILIDPSWLPGPYIENGLVYGVSYVGYRHYFYNDYKNTYPNLYTWEGMDKPMSFFRILYADNQALLKSGKNIYVLYSPGRKAPQMIEYLRRNAARFKMDLTIDTVFVNSYKYEQLYRVRNNNNWRTVNEGICGFEYKKNNRIYTDDERTKLSGRFKPNRERHVNGLQSIELNSEYSQSPSFRINNVQKGDYVEIIIKRYPGKKEDNGKLVFSYQPLRGKRVEIKQDTALKGIGPHWEIMRINATIIEQPKDSTFQCYFQYDGEERIYLDDFSFKHFSNQ